MPPPPDGSESGAVREKSGSEARSSPLFVRQALISDGGLYEIPWCDSVPEEYVLGFYSVTCRARDMSLETVRARQAGKDTGGSSFPSMTTARWYPTPSPA